MSYDVLQGSERWLDVALTAQANGIDAVTNATYADVSVRYRKEGDISSTLKTLVASDWRNLDAGVYRVNFTVTELNTLGSFTYSVVLALVYACTEFMPYYGHVDVVSGSVTTLTTNLTTVGNNVLGVSGRVETAITDILAVDGHLTTVGNDVTTVNGNVLGVSGRVETAITDILAVDGHLTTVGNNVLGVSGRVETAITDILAVDGHLTTVGNDVTTVNSNVLGVSGEVLVVAGDILVVDGKVSSLQSSVLNLNNFMVGAGAYYDADAGSLKVSFVLHKNGVVVSNPISATVIGYSETGVQLFTDTSSSPDAQGVFGFVETVTLTEKTVPYLKATIVDADGTHHTVTLTPVVG